MDQSWCICFCRFLKTATWEDQNLHRMETVNRHGHFLKIAFSILTLSSEIALTVINDEMNLDYCEILSLSVNSNSLFN